MYESPSVSANWPRPIFFAMTTREKLEKKLLSRRRWDHKLGVPPKFPFLAGCFTAFVAAYLYGLPTADPPVSQRMLIIAFAVLLVFIYKAYHKLYNHAANLEARIEQMESDRSME